MVFVLPCFKPQLRVTIYCNAVAYTHHTKGIYNQAFKGNAWLWMGWC
jgi:hypothetical protein